VLCLQCEFELGRFEKIDDLVKEYYSDPSQMPYDVFVLW
jgi:hypothetical protein